MNEKKIDWPAEITFKVVFRNDDDTIAALSAVLEKNNLDAVISSKKSSNCKFVSHTVTATFPADENLKRVCTEISSIKGYMTMF